MNQGTQPDSNTSAVTLTELINRQAMQNGISRHITLDDYAQAVTSLAILAITDCGAARAAAQVLLSLYNGDNWHVNVTDLRLLDAQYYRDAIIAIRGRCEFNQEPHLLIDNGDAIFERLQNEWRHYHVKNRYKKLYQ